MLYAKLIAFILLFISVLNSGLIIRYENINYWNTYLILLPIFAVGLLYFVFSKVGIRKINFKIFEFRFNILVSFFLLFTAVLLVASRFSFDKLVSTNFGEIRTDFVEQSSDIRSQITPLIIVYPFVHALYLFANNKSNSLKFFFLLLPLLFIGIATGGRQLIFQLFIIFLFSRKINFFQLRTVLFSLLFISLASIVSIGRFSNSDLSKAQFYEAVAPITINETLKDESSFNNMKILVIEASFYFGHSVPAFCNKVKNLHFSILPTYVFAMQPFVERQLSKFGILSYSQMDRFNKLLDLSSNSGFFRDSWSTGFLDIYSNLGIIGSILFFLMAAFILYQTEQNIDYDSEKKYNIIRGMNVLIIISMFMTPVFFDTTIFFSYTLIFISKIRI